MKYLAKGIAVVALVIGAMVWTTTADAAKIKVAGIYTQPIQQKWDARLHLALGAAEARGDIDYVFS